MKFIRSAVIFIFIIVSLELFAIGSDTLYFNSHNREVVVTDPTQGSNSYPKWVKFPSQELDIRKITMYVTFGCPDTMRCADWDYLDHIMVQRVGGINSSDLNWEIGRIITPYGGFFDNDWQFKWQADVTDFSMILRDSVEINYIHTGWEPNNDRGWLISIDFEIITGTPVAVPISITEIYNDHFPYGDSLKPIDQTLLPKSFITETNTDFVRLRVLQTGHGMDEPDNCGEFCSKYREIYLDDNLVQKRQMWMTCGDNPLYPQAGTWIFDRANWCPGYLVQPEIFDLATTSGKEQIIRFIMEPYTATKQNQGKQVISAYLIQYQQLQHVLDISIEDIVAPSIKDIYLRKNPAAANPQIILKNNGKETIYSATIIYKTEGFKEQKEEWRGELPVGSSELITLSGLVNFSSGRNIFTAKVQNPNGKADQYPDDNVLSTTFNSPPVHDTLLVFRLLTNNQPEHNSWKLISHDGKVVVEKRANELKARTLYSDTLRLSQGAYTLLFSDSAGDGLEFWYNSDGGRGEAWLLDGNDNLIKAFEPDCGLGWIYNFTVSQNPDPINRQNKAISLYPARTSDFTKLTYFANHQKDIIVKLISDPGGEVVEERNYPNLKKGIFDFDLTRFSYGRFFLKVFADGQEIFNKRIRYVEPAKEPDADFYVWPTDPLVSQKLHDWQDWKFGVIIHWGPYSEWGVVESWSLCPEDEPWCIRQGPFAHDYYTYVQEYEKIQQTFNPQKFNPDKWADACKRAGMKYVIFTTKHHDGFCMYDSKYTDYKITGSESLFAQNPKSNIAFEVFEAFRKTGMRTGAYFSKPDWHNDDYWWPYFPVFDRNVNYAPSKYPERWERFRKFVFNQIEELMGNYGKIDILWLDGGWVRPVKTASNESNQEIIEKGYNQDIDMPSIAKRARQLQPDLIIVDRTVHGMYENYTTPEQEIPDHVPNHPWESCITLGDSWYHTGPEENYKSLTWAVHTLIKIIAKGGNLLLGIGPDKTGDFAPEVYTRLEEIGNWINVNNEAIYGTKPLAPYHHGNLYFTQAKDEKTKFAFCLKEESDNFPNEIKLPFGVDIRKAKIKLLGYKGSIRATSIQDETIIKLPKLTTKLKNSPALVFSISITNQY